MTPQLDVLRCSACSAPVALADAATVKCTSCGADVVVPQAYRDAFEKMRRDSATRAEANALYGKLGEPPRALRAVGVVFDPSDVMNPLVGSRNLLVRAIGWYYRWVLLLFAPFIVLVIAMIAVVVAMRVIGAHYHANVLETLPASTRDWIELPVPIAGVLVGTALGVYGRRKALSRQRLQAALAAKPPEHAGGPSSCRACGGALSVAGDALGVRCVYCGADNLVALPQAWLAHLGAQTAAVAGEITVAGAELASMHRKLRRTMWLRVGVIVAALGLMITIALATGSDDPVTDHVPPSWSSFATDPRPLVRRDVVKGVSSDKIETISFAHCPAVVTVPPADCDAAACTVRLYAALRRGDSAELSVDPAALAISVEDHTGYPWPKTPGGQFGDLVGHSPKFDVTWSSWHEIAVTVPAGTRSLSLCFAVHHP